MLKLRYRGALVKGMTPRIVGPDGKVVDNRQWDILSPVLAGYDMSRGYPTFGLEGLRQAGLL